MIKRYFAVFLCAAQLTGCAAQNQTNPQQTAIPADSTEILQDIPAFTTTAASISAAPALTTSSSMISAEPVTTTSSTTAMLTMPTTTSATTVTTTQTTTSLPLSTTSTSRHIILHSTSWTAPFTTTVQPVLTSATNTTAVRISQGQSLSGIKIGLDPGHQRHANLEQETVAPNSKETKRKVSGGTAGVSTGIPEYETVLQMSKMLRDKLTALGATVYMTRETHDVNLSNQERTKMMNAYGVDIMLRIHCDGSDNPKSSGTTLYVSKSNSIAKQSRLYAETILPCMTEATGAKSNGVRQTDTYTGNNWATIPCILMECGFMSNPQEDVLLNSTDYQEKLTDGIVNGLVKCFS